MTEREIQERLKELIPHLSPASGRIETEVVVTGRRRGLLGEEDYIFVECFLKGDLTIEKIAEKVANFVDDTPKGRGEILTIEKFETP